MNLRKSHFCFVMKNYFRQPCSFYLLLKCFHLVVLVHLRRYFLRKYNYFFTWVLLKHGTHQMVGPSETLRHLAWKSLQEFCMSLVVILYQSNYGWNRTLLSALPVLCSFMQYSFADFSLPGVASDVVSSAFVALYNLVILGSTTRKIFDSRSLWVVFLMTLSL